MYNSEYGIVIDRACVDVHSASKKGCVNRPFFCALRLVEMIPTESETEDYIGSLAGSDLYNYAG